MKTELKPYEKFQSSVVLVNIRSAELLYMNKKAKIEFLNENGLCFPTEELIAAYGKESITVQLENRKVCFDRYEGYMDEDNLLVIEKTETAKEKKNVEKVSKKHIYELNDHLTGLVKAEYFYKYGEEILCNNEINENLAIIYFNIDNFKAFNSEYGYPEGDRLLQKLSELISHEFGEYIVGRMSDDHFIAIAKRECLIERITNIHEEVHHMQKNVVMEIKTGIYEYETGASIIEAHDMAKIACDTLKGDYSKNYCIYNDSLRKEIMHEKYIIDNLDKAIEKEYLKVYYQPIMRVFSNRICEVESLVRWIDPNIGFLSPAEFIPILEKRRLIHKLDMYVFERVCRDMVNAKKMEQKIVPASINLSRMDFQLCDITGQVCSITEKYGISHDMINLEVTESALGDDEENLKDEIIKLRELGFGVWLDDFGCEYSTLNTLQNFKFDTLKIDMKFFAGFNANENAHTIIMAIVDMAKRLHMSVLAEGIETKQQYEFLKKIGCDKAQGFYLYKPMTSDALYVVDSGFENKDEALYYDNIGKVNFLSPNPIEDYKDAKKLYNVTPTAIIQYVDGRFSYLYANEGYLECLESMYIYSIADSEVVINDDTLKLKTRLMSLAQKTHSNKQFETSDFIVNGCHVNLGAKEIAVNGSSAAYFVTMFNLSSLENEHKLDKLELSLNFLYSIYERVDLIDVTNNKIENIYLSSQYYQTLFYR